MVATRRSTRTTTAQPRQLATAAQAGDDSDLSECESSAASAASDDEEDAAAAHSYDSFESDEDASELDDDHDEDFKLESDKPKTSKRKKSAPSSRKKQKASRAQAGPSFKFTRLPNELLVEVFSHLEPTDLLSLRKTSRDFHAFLSTKNSAFAWKAARENIGLPDPLPEMSDIAYSRLLFEKSCQHCGIHYSMQADLCLGLRMCKSCRKQNWVKLHRGQIRERFPSLHPLAIDCVKHTAYTPANAYVASDLYCYLPHLKSTSKLLFDLDETADLKRFLDGVEEDEGEVDDSADSNADEQEEGDTEHEEIPPAGRSWLARHYPDFIDRWFINADQLAALPPSLRELVETVRKGNKATVAWSERVYDALRDHQAKQKRQSVQTRWTKLDRRFDLEDRVHREYGLLLTDYNDSLIWSENKLVSNSRALTEAEWLNIKDKVLEIAKKAKMDVTSQRRQSQIKTKWHSLRQGNTGSAVSLPFSHFLHLPAVNALLCSDDAVTDKAWAAAVDDVLEDIDEWRVDVRIEAIKTILAATTEKTRQELDKMDADDFAEFDDKFFERPTSYLVCTLYGCRDTFVVNRSSFRYSTSFYGPLAAVLKHQCDVHDQVMPLRSLQRKNSDEMGSQYNFALPPAVVSALSAVIDLAGLDDESATVQDLDNFTPRSVPYDTRAYRLRYVNSPTNQRYHWTWRHLMDSVVRLDRHQPKLQPLPVPTIASIPRGAAAVALRKKDKQRKKRKRTSAWDYDDDED